MKNFKQARQAHKKFDDLLMETIVKLLLAKGADVNAQGYGNALQAASSHGHENIHRLLLEKGAGLRTLPRYALQTASSSGNERVVKLLLKMGVDVNGHSGHYYGTALQEASSHGHETVVKLLLGQGAHVNAQGGQYGNVLQAASVCGHENIVKLLLEKDAQGGY